MKRFFYSLFILFICMSCNIVNGKSIKPSNNYVTKTIAVNSFHGISTSCAIDVKYTQAPGTPKVEIYASDNVINLINVKVDNSGILTIGLEKNTQIKYSHSNKKMEVHVSSPYVDKLSSSSAGDIYLLTALKCNKDLYINASSSGDVKGSSITCHNLSFNGSSAGDMKLTSIRCNEAGITTSSSSSIKINSIECNKIVCEASSAGDISINNGHAKDAIFGSSSAGDIKAKNFIVNVLHAKASSAGSVTCGVVDEIYAEASSAGSVNYKGNPRSIHINSKGVNKIN